MQQQQLRTALTARVMRVLAVHTLQIVDGDNGTWSRVLASAFDGCRALSDDERTRRAFTVVLQDYTATVDWIVQKASTQLPLMIVPETLVPPNPSFKYAFPMSIDAATDLCYALLFLDTAFDHYSDGRGQRFFAEYLISVLTNSNTMRARHDHGLGFLETSACLAVEFFPQRPCGVFDSDVFSASVLALLRGEVLVSWTDKGNRLSPLYPHVMVDHYPFLAKLSMSEGHYDTIVAYLSALLVNKDDKELPASGTVFEFHDSIRERRSLEQRVRRFMKSQDNRK